MHSGLVIHGVYVRLYGLHPFQYVMDNVHGGEKKEVNAKSLAALKKMGHGNLKLNDHESAHLLVFPVGHKLIYRRGHSF